MTGTNTFDQQKSNQRQIVWANKNRIVEMASEVVVAVVIEYDRSVAVTVAVCVCIYL